MGMSETTNEMISALEKDERLTIDRKSPAFPNQAQRASKAHTPELLRKQQSLSPFSEGREPSQRLRSSEETLGVSKLSPVATLYEATNPKRTFSRRNSKTAAMMVGSAVASFKSLQPHPQEHRRYQRRNSVVKTVLFPITKSSILTSRGASSSDDASSHTKDVRILPNASDEELRQRLRTSLGLASDTGEGRISPSRPRSICEDDFLQQDRKRRRGDNGS